METEVNHMTSDLISHTCVVKTLDTEYWKSFLDDKHTDVQGHGHPDSA